MKLDRPSAQRRTAKVIEHSPCEAEGLLERPGQAHVPGHFAGRFADKGRGHIVLYVRELSPELRLQPPQCFRDPLVDRIAVLVEQRDVPQLPHTIPRVLGERCAHR